MLESQLLKSAWRLSPSRYAEHLSRGRWVRYHWIATIMEFVRSRIVKGGARIIINVPPRHGKSEGCSYWLPAWYMDLYPERQIIIGAYGNEFAAKWGRRVRDLLESDVKQHANILRNKRAASDWVTTDGGGMMSVGVDGSVTGNGGHLIIVDDPHKNWEEALSQTYRRRVIDWFQATLYTRCEPGASIIVIQTRWHENDLTGYLLNEHADPWELIRLPAIAEEDDLLGREVGEPLCPERYTTGALLQIKKALSSQMFAGLYQQRPAPLEGNLVKRTWFQRFNEMPASFSRLIQAWDLTFTDSGSSYVVGTVWGKQSNNFFLVDCFRDKLDFPGTISAIKRMSAKWPNAKEIVIEEAANGYAAISTLKKELPGVIGRRPLGSKTARLMAVSGLIEAGNVWIPSRSLAEWSDDFIEEIVNFPNGANDDRVDALTHALSRLSENANILDVAFGGDGSRTSPWAF
jgi:predicted phage terminase large subunit-like protein